MIFKPEHIRLILAGQKTMTRRLGERRWVEGAVHPIKPHWYAKPEGYIRVLSVSLSRLGATTDEDARREGYPSLAQYREVWERVYGRRWQDELEVWVITFCVHDGPVAGPQQPTFITGGESGD